jgi:hypothetical protein
VLGIPVQRRVRRQGEIRADEVCLMVVLAAPFRRRPANVEVNLVQVTFHMLPEKGLDGTVRSALVRRRHSAGAVAP